MLAIFTNKISFMTTPNTVIHTLRKKPQNTIYNPVETINMD